MSQSEQFNQAPYPSGPYAGGPAVGTDVFAILSLVFGFVFWPLGIIFGFVARSRIKRTGAGGRGLALAGIIVGIVIGLLSIVYVIGVFAFLQSHSGSLGSP